MKSVKALVVEHDEQTRQVIDEVLLALGHKYEMACSLAEARDLLAANGYAYVLLNCVIPARPGGTPRRQNAENFLDDLRKIKAPDAPPVIVMFDSMDGIEDEAKVSWASDLTLRGARRFIRKPFRTEGRTLDRVIKKVLAGEPEPMRFVNIPVVRITHPYEVPGGIAARTDPMAGGAGPAPSSATPAGIHDDSGTGKWLTVTDAAKLLMHDVPSLDLAKARSRISTAAGRKEFTFTGQRRDRRIEPHTFNTWRLKQRDRDMDEEDDQ